MFSIRFLRALQPYLWPYKHWLLFSLLMAIPLSVLRTGPIPLIKLLIDEVLIKKDTSKLIYVPFAIIGLYLVNLGVRFLHYYSVRIAVTRTNQLVRERLYAHLIRLSADYFSEKRSGALLSRITADPAQLDSGISSLNVLIREPIMFLVLFGYALYTNWKLTLLTLSIVPALGWVFSRSGRYIKKKIAEYQEMNGESYSLTQEAISGIRMIQLYNLTGDQLRRYSDQLSQITKVLLRISRMEELAGPMVELITSFAIALILYFGGLAVLKGEMSSGDLIAFFTAFGMMINPVRMLSDINSKMNAASAAMDRIQEFLAWEPRVRSASGALAAVPLQTGIEFKNVSFAYPDSPSRSVISDVSFTLSLGKTVALVGQSGSGKSSMVQLLTRLYDVSQGEIRVDGVDLRNLDLDTWRDQVAVVSQDVFLFHDTIFNNIRMGRPDAPQDAVIEAARKAHALEFISRLPGGFATIVGDRGLKLSGGERQRISIARAFLKNSSCLILDEATSNLDNESERIVQSALEELMENRTTLVIAHRLSTIRNADEILVMREGRVLERGTYESLLSLRGEFRRLVEFARES
jgi:subfamily B ATP-binding cassette protein MsbA